MVCAAKALWLTTRTRRIYIGMHGRLRYNMHATSNGQRSLLPTASVCPPPLPHLHRDWAHPFHVCTGTGHTPSTSALGPGLPISTMLHTPCAWRAPLTPCVGQGSYPAWRDIPRHGIHYGKVFSKRTDLHTAFAARVLYRVDHRAVRFQRANACATPPCFHRATARTSSACSAVSSATPRGLARVRGWIHRTNSSKRAAHSH